MDQESQWGFETQAVRIQAQRSPAGEHAVPIYMTSSYLFDDAEDARARFAAEKEGPIYSRYTNPNTDELVEKLCALEGCEDGLATASGMAAVWGVLGGLLSQGDQVLACRNLFGSTFQVLTQILPRFGIEPVLVDLKDQDRWEASITPRTKLILVETPTNPALELVDLVALGALGKKHGIPTAVDNCFATPYLQNPAKLGCDLVIHSATKFIDGQGRGLGGVILGPQALIEPIRFFLRHTGPAMSPFNAWIFSKGLETLGVRMDRHCANALALAQVLEAHPAVAWVRYPFLDSHPQAALARSQMKQGGGLVAFELKGGLEAGRRFLSCGSWMSLTANLGDTRTTVTHPASTTHSKLTEADRLAAGVTPGLVRISAGLETWEDLKAEVLRALEA